MTSDAEDDVSYDRLNALVDGELDRFEEGRVLDAIRHDPDLKHAACELRLTKQLVRSAYQHERPARNGERWGAAHGRRWKAVAAFALIAVGAVAGWMGHVWEQRDNDLALAQRSDPTASHARAAASDRVILHVGSSAPERVSTVLDEAEEMLRAARAAHRAAAVEIVANNTGLDILRADVSPYVGRLEALRAQYPNLTLVACGLTVQRLRDKGVAVRLIPDTIVSTSALDQILKRIHEGWTYLPS
jgi:intracellular sulfur oxidation DsrE/DsrF family protein